MNIIDTTKTVIDTLKNVVDSTAVEAVSKPIVENTTIWQDKALMEVFAIVGGILLILVGLLVWDIIDEKRNSKK